MLISKIQLINGKKLLIPMMYVALHWCLQEQLRSMVKSLLVACYALAKYVYVSCDQGSKTG